MATQTANPTDGDDIIIVAEDQVAGGTFDGGLGNDALQLTGNILPNRALSFDFTTAALLTGFETVRGTTTTDYITLSASQINSISTFDSGGNGYYDYVQPTGAAIDLRNKILIGPVRIQPLTASATITVNSMAIANVLNGSEAPGLHLVLEGIVLTAEERRAIHNRGIDFITDASAVTTIDTAPQLSGINGDLTNIQAGQTYHVDLGQDAIITEDYSLSRMYIELEDWSDDNDDLSIDTTGVVDLVPTTASHYKIFVSNVEIGTLNRIDATNQLWFNFNSSATPTLVQELIRAVTYKYDGPATPFGSNEVTVEVFDSGDRSTTAKFTLVYTNDAPTDLTLSSSTVAENSSYGTEIGKIQATDPNPNDDISLSLVDDAGGRFFLSWDGTLKVKDPGKLDYEQGHSYTIKVRATDSGGLTFEKTYSITVTDVPDSTVTDLTLSSSAVAENSSYGTEIGKIQATDPNPNDDISLSLVDDAGGRFFLSWDGTLKVKDPGKLDYEQGHSYTIKVRATGSGGLTFEKTFSITVTDVPDSTVTDVPDSGGITTPNSTGSGFTIRGTPEKNILKGTAADETIFGGFGNDVLTGGAGKDTFVFDSKLGTSKTDRKVNFDTITDFSVKDDVIWLDNKYFKQLGKGTATKPGKLNKSFFTIGDHAKDKNDYLIYDKKTGILSYDTDGSGMKQTVEIAKLPKAIKITYKDFFII